MRSAVRVTCTALVLALAGMLVAAEPQAVKKPPAGKNLLPNGDFEAGDDMPKHWQTIDGLTTFWVKDDDPKRGKVLKIDTDVLQSQGYEWWVKITKGAKAKDAPKKEPSKDPNKYDTLAGLDGVWFWSDLIPVKKSQAYWLTVDAKGPSGGMLAWLVGYPDKPATAFGADAGAFQEFLQQKITNKPLPRGRNFEPFIKKYKYRGQLSSIAGSSASEWRTFSRRERPFRPTENTPDVRYVRVLLYAYWPPGLYYFDNVRLSELPEK